MANNVQETLRELLISTIEGAGKSDDGGGDSKPSAPGKGGSGAKGLAAGVGAAALAPMALKGLSRLAREAGMDGVQDMVKSPGKAVKGLGSSVGGQVGSNLGDKVSEKVDEAGGASGILSDTVKDVLPFGGGGGGGDKGGGLGIGKGRRMPVQQSIDIGAPIETVYNQWTQFEDWPKFMHRVISASQDEDNTVKFTVKIWTRTREFTAEIETQRPNDRIIWKVSEGISHAGLVTFHELAPNLTRVLMSIDVQPGGMIEKMARGMRHVKRAARGDLHRFKAYIEMAGEESGAWRGVIEGGEVVEEHDPSYDEEREYSDPEEVMEELEASEESDDDDAKAEEENDEEQPRSARPRRRRSQSSNGRGTDDEKGSGRQSNRSRSSSRSRSTSSGGGSGSSRRGSSRSSNGGGSGSSRRSSGGSRSSSGSSSSRRSRSSND
jgi:polyketide cyclase/dehydrase/lipid transport protein